MENGKQESSSFIIRDRSIYIRFIYTDYALARAFVSRLVNNIHLFTSYDSACSFEVKAPERWASKHPDVKHLIERTQFSIDSLHVNDHQEKCIYLYGAAYQPSAGHFHGVGTEQFWSENNQMCGQTKQMSPGHRHDKIIEHSADWGWKKSIRSRMYYFLCT